MPIHPRPIPACVIHCRVSTQKQAYEGESLDVQASICSNIAIGRGWEIAHAPWKESFSGRKTQRPVFEDILSFIDKHPGCVRYYLFRSIDRMTRGGTVAYDHMKRELARRGVEMVDSLGLIQPVRNTLEDVGVEYDWSMVSPSEISEAVTATTAKTEVTTILTRLIGEEIRLRRRGYKIRGPVDGFVNAKTIVEGRKRTVEQPHPERAKYFVAMFELRAAGLLSDEQVCERMNAIGYRSRYQNRWNEAHTEIIGKTGGALLIPKRLQEIIRRPIYCGVICEKWTGYKPIRAAYPGLVSIELFNAANRGKVHIRETSDGSLEILYDYHPEPARTRCLKDNPEFPFKNVIGCPVCRKPLMASSPRGRSGQRFPTYHCARQHKYLGIPKATLEDALRQFVRMLRFDPEAVSLAREELLEKYHARKEELRCEAADIADTVAGLELRKAEAVKSFKLATTDLMRRSLEADAEDYERQIRDAGTVRGRMEMEESDIDAYLEDARRIIEHPSLLLGKAVNPTVRAARYSVVFDSIPTYEEIASRTAKKRSFFYLSSDPDKGKSALVRLRSLDWNQIEEEILHWKRVSHLLNLQGEADGGTSNVTV